MKKELSKYFLENPKMLSHLEEQSYYIKYLNRNEEYLKSFISKMKEIYHERASDKVASYIDTVELISNVVDTLN